jgi:hypothetical protein
MTVIRAIILKGPSQYGALRLFSDELHRSFLKLKVDSVLIDTGNGNWIDTLENQLRIGCSFVAAFNGIGAYLKVGDKSLYNIVNIPYIGIYVDHPLYHIKRLSNKIDRYIVTVVDKKHIQFLNSYFGEKHFSMKRFLPHGGISNKLAFNEKQFNSRSDNVLFTGTYRGLPEKKWLSIDNSFLKNFIQDVFNARSEFMSIEESMEYVIDHRNIAIESNILNKIKMYTIRHIDNYDKAKARFDIIRYLLENGIAVDIYGNGNWNEFLSDYKNANYKGNVEMKALIDLYSNYKIALNDNNNFRNGSHERIFNVLANGCQCITSMSSYYDEIFHDDKSVIKYFRDDFGDLNTRIKESFREESYANISKTKQYVLDNHMWINRAEEILKLYKLM